MKFRTDFVTNSSDSSFLTFNVKNKALFQCLTNLGIKFEETKENEFSDTMRIVLPSGESTEIDGGENWSLPYVDDCPSISAWIVALLLWEVEDVYPAKEEDEYSEFSKELIALLNEADITHLDWEAVEYWSRDKMMEDLSAKFDQMDGDIEEASIEHTYGFEGEVGPCIYTEVHNGKRLSVNYSNQDGIETEDCDGLKFVVTGKLKYFENRDEIVEAIEDMGGSVSDSISKNTDYLICNDIHSTSSKMKKAKELGISVLTELAFIRRFCDPEDFDDISDNDEVGEDAWDMTYEGDVLDFVVENGTQPIVMEVWKDGRWQRGVSDQKTAAKNAAESAKREEARSLAANMFAEDSNSTLKTLLLNKTRDCLEAGEDTSVKAITFEELCTRGSIRFEMGPIDAMEEKDCFLIVQKEESKSIFGDQQILLTFTTICKHCICDLSNYKNRALEISSAIIDLISGKELPGNGKIHYMACSSQAISDEYACYTLMFKVGDDMFTSQKDDVNVIKGYEKDNACITDALLSDIKLKSLMGIDNATTDDVYVDGYFRTSEFFSTESGREQSCWLILTWDFSIDTSLNVVPVSRDQKLVADLTKVIKEKLSGIELPVRGTLNYSKDYSKEDIKLSDNLYCGMLSFR